MRLTALALLSSALLAQQIEQLSFEAASIKPHRGVITFSADPTIRGRRVVATASTLLDFITYAYSVRYDQITGGPGWTGSDHYDLEAVAGGEGTLTPEQSRQMVRSLLSDRFQLRIHFDRQEVPAYALIVAKGGPRLKTAPEDAKPGGFTRGSATGNHLEVTKGTMEELARRLSGNGAGRPVVDKTGLGGYFAYTLDYAPNTSVPAESDVPLLSSALQDQLGLRLESTRALSQKLVVDQADQPSSN
jgi:uncharacterized protein (TIGR03435 family)